MAANYYQQTVLAWCGIAAHVKCAANLLLTKDNSMEVNPLYNALDDLQARTDVLRGYL
jgi:hypothetical protein